MKNHNKSEILCNVTLSAVLVATAIHILILTLNLFGVTNFGVPKNFNYIFAYVLTVICLGLYIFGFAISKFKRMVFPAWLRIFFYIAFFLFTNVYYFMGLFTKAGTIILFYAYIGFLISILSVSIFYNTQKDEKNRLKSTNKFISLSVFCYSVAFSTIVQFIISLVKVIFFGNAATSVLSVYVISIASMLTIISALSIAFYVSLRKSKKFINACLVKYTMRVVVKKPIKETTKETSKEAAKEQA